MKSVVYFHEMAGDGPVWRNGFAPFINLLGSFGDVQLLRAAWPQHHKHTGIHHKAKHAISRTVQSRRLADKTNQERFEPDLLLAIALNAEAVRGAALTFERVRASGVPRVLYVVENVEPQTVRPWMWKSFDRIVCFCPELSEIINRATDVPTDYWPPHLDLLTYHASGAYRPIDMLCFGRSRPNILFDLQRRFSGSKQQRLIIDFVTRSQADRRQSASEEFGLLFDALSKSRATLCFAPHDVDRFKGRSPLLARWVYAWAAGCVVYGTRPRAAAAQAHMNWTGSTIELPDDDAEASAMVEAGLADVEATKRQGLVNLAQTLSRHDTRYRLEMLLLELGLAVPPSMSQATERLSEMSQALHASLAAH